MPEEFMLVLAIASVTTMFAVIAIAFQAGSVFRARAVAMHEAEYRRLVQEATEAQRRVSESLDHAIAEIAALRGRAESMERLLQEVG